MKTLATFIFCITTLTIFSQDIIDSNTREIVILHVNVVPMNNESIIKDQTVIVHKGKISAMGANLKYNKNALVIEAREKFLIPGLAEMHAHVPPIDDIGPMKEVLFLFVANGITTIRGMLGHPKHLELRDMIKSGEVLGPHFYTTGPSFSGMSIKSPEAGETMVRNQKSAGYDYLKLHPGLTKENFASIAKTAKEVGIPFVGHVSFGVGVWRAIDAEYSSIDHLDGFIEGMVPGIETMVEQQAGLFGMYVADKVDTTLIPKLMNELKSHHVWVVPTQSLAERWFAPDFDEQKFRNEPDFKFIAPETAASWIESKKNLMNNPSYQAEKIEDYIQLRRKLIKACQHYGVGLLLGCDAPQVFNVPGSSTHNELEYLVRSGLTPFQALQTGTVNVARYLNQPDAGTIKPGAIADLVLINGDPLKDIRNTKKIEGVLVQGKWLSKQYLATALSQLVKN